MKGATIAKFLLIASALGSISNLTHAMGVRPLQIDSAVLGSARLESNGEVAKIHVRQCVSDGIKIKHLFLVADLRPLRIDRIVIEGMDGQTKTLEVNADLPAHASLRIENIPEEIRCVKEIRLEGKATSGRFGSLLVGAKGQLAQ